MNRVKTLWSVIFAMAFIASGHGFAAHREAEYVAADAPVYNFLTYRKAARGEQFERTALIEKYILPLMQARVDSVRNTLPSL